MKNDMKNQSPVVSAPVTPHTPGAPVVVMLEGCLTAIEAAREIARLPGQTVSDVVRDLGAARRAAQSACLIPAGPGVRLEGRTWIVLLNCYRAAARGVTE